MFSHSLECLKLKTIECLDLSTQSIAKVVVAKGQTVCPPSHFRDKIVPKHFISNRYITLGNFTRFFTNCHSDFEEDIHRNVVKYNSAKLMGSFVIFLFSS